MSKKKHSITLHIRGMEPIEFRSSLDDPVLELLCQGLVTRTDPENQILYLEFGEEPANYLYFPRSLLQAIETSSPIPHDYFFIDGGSRDRDAVERIIGKEWMNWAQENIRRGCDKDMLFQMMRKAGFDHDVVCTAIEYVPNRPFSVMEYAERESIRPLTVFDYSGLERFDSEYIELYTIDGFLSDSECDHMVLLIGDQLTRSTVVGQSEPHHSRTSYTCQVSSLEDDQKMSRIIQGRICKLVGADLINAEPLQGQIYEAAQEYLPHFDYFTDEFPDYDAGNGEIRSGQRLWSFVIYLSDSPEGSGTRFPELDIEFTPVRGTAIFWRNLYPSGKPNPYTLHQGTRVKQGKKIVLTQWIRDS